jgi:Holliday junction DNA helicase RuvA
VIASLQGEVAELRESSLVVVCGGVGYEVWIPKSSLARLSVGQEVRLLTRLLVREDAWTLYGFLQPELLSLFDLLTSVSGVGARTALNLLSTLPLPVLVGALAQGDSALLSSVPGIGRRLAERTVLELQGRLPGALLAETQSGPPGENQAVTDALAALLSLGFSDAQVRPLLREEQVSGPELDAEALIRRVLGRLRRR